MPAKAPAKNNGGLNRLMRPSADLAAIVGAEPLPRTEIVSKLWAYIKANKLQDAKDGRRINADAKLKPIFSPDDQISMFEMNKRIGSHMKAA